MRVELKEKNLSQGEEARAGQKTIWDKIEVLLGTP
jgi:hypothetical protein